MNSKKMAAWVLALTAFVGSLSASTTVSLNGTWRLDYFPQPDDGAVRTLPVTVPFKTVDATVPGNCELDLVNAGVLPPPEVGLNILKLRPYEGYQWLYTKTFESPEIGSGQRAMLTFDGVDTLADVFLNGVKVGETDNMLIPHAFDVTKLLRDGENSVQVLIRSVMCEAQHQTLGELGWSMGDALADAEPFRKAGHMGGWDIFPRAFVSGLWRGVSLEVQDPVRIDQTAWIVKTLEVRGRNRANLQVMCRVQAPFRHIGHAQIRYAISRGGKTIAERSRRLDTYQNIVCDWVVHGFEPWWPKGMGEPALYDATIEIVGDDGARLARHSEKIGFRTIALERDDVYGPERPGQFLFRVNGEPCYIRGSNWVPLDAFHGRDGKFMRSTLEMFDDLNCNMVRVWGGGVYEPDEFFDFCDAHGIMVWQDFMTGCSVFPQGDAYAKATEKEVRAIVLKYRNRASLALWSGNNENDCAFRWKLGPLRRDPNKDRSSRRTIPDVLYEFDVTRPYLPSSPYEPPDVVAGKAKPSEMHLWGARAYYKVPFYTNSPCWFASEMGYHGMPNRTLLERVMTKGCVYPWKGSPAKFEKDHLKLEWNDEWQLKASNPLLRSDSSLSRRNNLMTNQIRIMFGGVDTDLDTFIAQSQFVQAEAMKTFCELFRSRKFTRFNGLIWWNVRDSWPQLSDAVVDYYGGKKRAYYALKAAQRNQLAMLRDDHTAWAVNDRRHPVKGHATYRDKATGRTLLDCDYEVPANAAVQIGEVPFSGQGWIDITYTADGETHRNHFLYGEPPFKWADVQEWMKGSVLPTATFDSVSYGPHARQVIDAWLPKSAASPAPAVVYIHGGGFRNGDRKSRLEGRIHRFLDAGIAFFSVEYRLLGDAGDVRPPVRVCMDDIEAAIRFVRSKAGAWNIDVSRMGLTGGSAGGCASLCMALAGDNALGIRAVLAQYPQTTLDPLEMREWIPNSTYGGLLFGYPDFETWLAHREEVLPWIERYSPVAHLRKCTSETAPEFFYNGPEPPPPGELAKDPTHCGTFSEKFREVAVARGISCRRGDDGDLIAALVFPAVRNGAKRR